MRAHLRRAWSWIQRHAIPYREAFLYLCFTAAFSILPTLSGFILVWAFGKWNGDWSKLLENGDLLVASTSLMASALYTFRRPEERTTFLRSVCYMGAILVIAFSSLFYGGLALASHEIIPVEVKMLPVAIITLSLCLYGVSLLIGFNAILAETRTPPSNQAIRDEQVENLESELEELGGEE